MTARQMMLPANRAFNSNGLAIPGATAELYGSGGLVPANFYADAALSVSLGPTLTTNGAGRFPTAYQSDAIAFRLITKDADGAELDDIDPFYFGTTSITLNSSFVTPQQFGAVADGVTEDSAAFVAAIAYLKSIGVNNDSNLYKGSAKLFIPAGLYNMGTTTLDITHTLIIEGESSLLGNASRLKWTGDCDGIRIQAANTSGASTVDGPHFGASYTKIKQLGLIGPYYNSSDFTGHTESESHAINARSNVVIEDVYIDGFAGDGVHANTTVGGGTSLEGNSNCSFINRLRVTNVRNGVYIDGADANAWTISGVIGTYCRQHTVWDSSFLGNTHIGHHSSGCAAIKGVSPSIVSYSGNRYNVRAGQAAGAATNAPSGTTADNAYWLYMSAGAADATVNIPTWSNPTTVRDGGSYYADNSNARNTFINCYSEGGEGLAQAVAPTLFIGGLWGTRDPVTTGNYLAGDKINAPSPNASGVALGQTRAAYNTATARILSAHNSAANNVSVYASLMLESGLEADNVTPQVASGIRGKVTTTNPATAEGVLEFFTRTFAGGGSITAWLELNGPNLRFAPLADNQLDFGIAAARWKTSYVYNLNAATSVLSIGQGGVGYATGAGGTVTQATNRTTGVTINKVCGAITLVSAAGSTSWQTFTVTNSTVAATDTVRVVQASGTDLYQIHVTNVAAGSFKISFATTGGTTTEQPVFNFSVIKGVTS